MANKTERRRRGKRAFNAPFYVFLDFLKIRKIASVRDNAFYCFSVGKGITPPNMRSLYPPPGLYLTLFASKLFELNKINILLNKNRQKPAMSAHYAQQPRDFWDILHNVRRPWTCFDYQMTICTKERPLRRLLYRLLYWAFVDLGKGKQAEKCLFL